VVKGEDNSTFHTTRPPSNTQATLKSISAFVQVVKVIFYRHLIDRHERGNKVSSRYSFYEMLTSKKKSHAHTERVRERRNRSVVCLSVCLAPSSRCEY